MLNRKNPPIINEIVSVPDLTYEKVLLDNGIPLYIIEAGTQPLLKMEIVFHAGRPYEAQQMVARATARILKEGTASYSAVEIAELTDFYGSNISTPVHLDTSSLVFHCLSKHLPKLLPIWTEILTKPVFPEMEIKSFVQNNLQRLSVDLTKNDVLAYRAITEKFFGSTHPYGYNSVPGTYQNLQKSWLQAHFCNHYIAQKCSIFLSGKPEKNAIALLNQTIGQQIPKGEVTQSNFPTFESVPFHDNQTNANSAQTAIRMGRVLFNRKHQDYAGFFVLNTILGGYFGSRLMANLREKKGYTYNIYSSLDAMHEEGAFLIGAEVANEHRDNAIDQILLEINKLRTEEVDSREMEMVRSYLMGSFLSMMDGPFNISEIVRTTKVENLADDHFAKLVDTVKNITPKDLRELAFKHLDPSSLSIQTVGP